MDFEDATTGLFRSLGHSALARTLGISVAAIRQARLSAGAQAYRAPPKNWRRGVLQLAEEQLAHYRDLVEALRADDSAALMTPPTTKKRKSAVVKKRTSGRTIADMRNEFSRSEGGKDGKKRGGNTNSRRG